MTERTQTKPGGGPGAWLQANWARLYFSAAMALIVFGYGMATTYFKWFPYQLIADGVAAARDWQENAEQYAMIAPSKHLRPARREGAGVIINKAGQTYPGITALTGMWGETLGVKLVDMDGELLHEWLVSFNEIWPAAEHLDRQPRDWDTNIHGMVVMPSGDVVFNFEHHGTVSIDACSNVNWKYASKTHHSVFLADDGNLWVSDDRANTAPDRDKFPLLKAPFNEDLITVLSPDGEQLLQVSVLEKLFESGYESLVIEPVTTLGGAGADVWMGTVTSTRADLTHMNDVELLTAEMAGAFPLFEAGDIMLSLRNIDAIVVLDGETYAVKWQMTGPWMMQHDPDFMPDGRIMVFDNRARIMNKAGTRGSRILAVDPVSRKVEVLYQGNPDEIFLTTQMGKQQGLPNGNILIAEPDGGRAFEVTPDREIVWEYVNRWSEKQVAVITEAVRLPVDYFDSDMPDCDTTIVARER